MEVLKVDGLTPEEAFLGGDSTGYIAETDERKVRLMADGKVVVFLTPVGARTSEGAHREVKACHLRITQT